MQLRDNKMPGLFNKHPKLIAWGLNQEIRFLREALQPKLPGQGDQIPIYG